jgi:uncharacterized protein YerC
MIGTGSTAGQALARLEADVNTRAFTHCLNGMAATAYWHDILTALSRVAAYLDEKPGPIDYDRRRHLDYTDLVSPPQWRTINRRAGTRLDDKARQVATAYLYERLSTRPARTHPSVRGDAAFATHLNVFVAQVNHCLRQGLDQAGLDFLNDRGINGEPVTWNPPMALLDDLHLPGDSAHHLEIAEVHRLISTEKLTITRTARTLGTTDSTVKYLLDQNPPVTTAISTLRVASAPARARAAATLDGPRLRRLYEVEHRSLRDIGALCGVSRQTITRLARSHGIPLRPAHRDTTHTKVQREWLEQEYVVKGRTLPDLAHERGVSTATMNRWAQDLGIAVRPRGTRRQAEPRST